MTDIKCLVHCSGISTYEVNFGGKKGIGGIVEFSFNYANQDPKHPNYRFFASTPEGKIEMHIDNPAALREFETGKDYSILLHPIDSNLPE